MDNATLFKRSGTDESITDETAECAILALDALLELNTLLSRRIEEETARALESSHQLMRQAHDAAMGEMIANIAHQWRQPLTSLSLILQNMRYDCHDDRLDRAGLDQYVDRAQLAIEQMSTTIDDFRQFFSRQTADKIFELRAACHKCEALIGASLAAHRIELAVTGEDIHVFGRESEFLQILLNLLVNAKDALLERKIAGGQIDIRIEKCDAAALITVTDNAGGIAPGIIDRIFEAHFSTKVSGSGIGLYMSRALIEQHFDGSIQADNWRDGARFRLRLATLAPPQEDSHWPKAPLAVRKASDV